MQFMRLLIKDFRLIYRESLIILVLGAGAAISAFLTSSNLWQYEKGWHFFNSSKFFLILFLYVFIPFIFLFSVIKEKMHKTNFQTFSLPVPRYKLLLSKFVLLLAAGVLVTVIPSLISYFFHLNSSSFEGIISMIIGKVSLFMAILGLFCVVLGMTAIVKKNRFLLGIILLSGFYYYHWRFYMYLNIEPILRAFYRSHFINTNSIILKNLLFGRFFFYPDIYLLTVGIVFLITGLVLYSKFEEI